VPAPDAVGTTTRTALALYSPAALRNTLNLYGETVGLPDRESLFVKDTPLGDKIKFDGNDASWVAVFLVIFAAIIGPVNLFLSRRSAAATGFSGPRPRSRCSVPSCWWV